MKRFGSFCLAAGFWLFAGCILTLLSIGGFIYILWRIYQLSETGTKVMATVAQVTTSEQKAWTYENHAFKRVPSTIHQLVAHWQNPQTGKCYAFKAFIRHPERFPVGSSVPFLIDPQHPRWWHRLENLQDI
jgi:hypothetical protein